MLGKTSWYKTNQKRKAEDEESEFKYTPALKKRKQVNNIKKVKGAARSKIKSVMFVPFTKHSELASRIRDNEERMEQMTGYKLKIVERGGTKLVDILHKANPWAGEDCERKNCLLCRTKRLEGKKNG